MFTGAWHDSKQSRHCSAALPRWQLKWVTSLELSVHLQSALLRLKSPLLPLLLLTNLKKGGGMSPVSFDYFMAFVSCCFLNLGSCVYSVHLKESPSRMQHFSSEETATHHPNILSFSSPWVVLLTIPSTFRPNTRTKKPIGYLELAAIPGYAIPSVTAFLKAWNYLNCIN